MDDCIFCKIIDGKIPSWKIFENENVYAFLDINPVNEYHTLVVPKAHYKDIFDVPEDTLKELIGAVKSVVTLLDKKLGIQNIQIINSSGVEAQQDVFHIHFHVVPRKTGDSQNIKWKTHPELVSKFDQLLINLKNE
jgi:histidine triad (HIT) family protein